MLPFTEWLPNQRWYAGRQRELVAVEPSTVTRLHDNLDHALLRVSYADGGTDHYQLLIGWDQAPLEDFTAAATIGHDGERIGYDALYEEPAARHLLELIRTGSQRGNLRFVPEPEVELPAVATAWVLDAEQSNTSVVFDRTSLLKLFRRVLPGINPDIELNRVLGRAGCPHVPRLLGAIEGTDEDGHSVSLAMVTEYAEAAADGWSMATASARDLLAELDLHPDEVGGDFSAESFRLGEAVAVVHQYLATELGTSQAPSPAPQMRARLAAAVATVPELADWVPAAREVFDAIEDDHILVQRIHSDFHLGQALRSTEGWLLIDFEGEPGVSIAERRRPDSPLRDIAGVNRSFEYAAYHLISGEERDVQLSRRAREWIDRNETSFCDGYAAVANVDPRDQLRLLRAYELDKALYETVYEARYRPSWVWIPLRSVSRILGGTERVS